MSCRPSRWRSRPACWRCCRVAPEPPRWREAVAAQHLNGLDLGAFQIERDAAAVVLELAGRVLGVRVHRDLARVAALLAVGIAVVIDLLALDLGPVIHALLLREFGRQRCGAAQRTLEFHQRAGRDPGDVARLRCLHRRHQRDFAAHALAPPQAAADRATATMRREHAQPDIQPQHDVIAPVAPQRAHLIGAAGRSQAALELTRRRRFVALRAPISAFPEAHFHDHRLPRPLHHRAEGPASLPQGPDRGGQRQGQGGDAAALRAEDERRRDQGKHRAATSSSCSASAAPT